MSINLGSNIHVQTTKPLDDKVIAADNTARDAILAGERYLGMKVFVTATGLNWQLRTGITNSDWVADDGGSASPLTTKGDVYTYSTVNARLGVGANGKVLTADSTAATGLSWQTPTAAGTISTSTVTGNGTVTVPTGATRALVEGCGGGSGGDGGGGTQYGGRGAYYGSILMAVQAGQVMTVAIGAGGGGANPGTGADGGATTLSYSVGPAVVTFPGATSSSGYASATASPFYTYGATGTYNGQVAYGGGGGCYGVGGAGLAGENNFAAYSAAANTGAGGGAASAGSNGQGGNGGSGKMIITWMS